MQKDTPYPIVVVDNSSSRSLIVARGGQYLYNDASDDEHTKK